MKAVAGLALLLVNVGLSRCCYEEGQILICQSIPPAFSPGSSSLVMILKDVGEINSTVLHSDNLSSVTRLRIESAGITGIAEGAFASFQNLMSLSLNQNLLTEINPKWLGRPDALGELTLTGNLIEVLSESMFQGLTNLTTLNLSKNRIRAVGPNSFSSQTVLAELDLSENRLTWVSPQVFSSLRSTRIRLHGNPWDCSCGAQDFIDFLKDLRRRSLLDRLMEVTCETPPSLRGQPVWNVSACVTSPPSSPPTGTQTDHPKPTARAETTPPSRPASDSTTSVQPKPTDTLTTVTTPALKTATYVTSPPSVTQISVRPKPSVPPITTSTPAETCAPSRPSLDTNIVCTLVIVVLSLLLVVAGVLVVLHRRKRNNKTVMPGCPNDSREELKDDGSGSSRAASPELSEKGGFTGNNHRDSEMGWRRSFAGVRAKSANAILFASPFCAPVRDHVTLQTETEAQSKENEADGKLGDETVGGTEADNLTHTTDVKVKQAAAGRNLDESPHSVADTVPYLSIGTNQNKPSAGDFNQTRKVIGRISTWPPTANQWQAGCKNKEEEEGSDIFAVWTPKFPGEVTKESNIVEQPSGPDRDNKEEEIEEHQMEDSLQMNVAHVDLGHPQSSEPNNGSTSFSEAHAEEQEEVIQDPVSDTHNLDQEKLGNQDLKPAENPELKITDQSSNKAEQRDEPKRAVTSRRRAGSRSRSSKAPSGGASPDDETLLSGNEYAFMDLLHEVVQNNGRWTRERWKQIHVNKQRR